MIQWWGWLLIWTGLVLALLAMVALFAWWLFRKFLTLMDDLGDLAEKGSLLEIDDPERVAPQIAVLADIRDIRDRENARKAHRAQRRRLRWERRLQRGKRITTADATLTQWPADWYGS